MERQFIKGKSLDFDSLNALESIWIKTGDNKLDTKTFSHYFVIFFINKKFSKQEIANCQMMLITTWHLLKSSSKTKIVDIT